MGLFNLFNISKLSVGAPGRHLFVLPRKVQGVAQTNQVRDRVHPKIPKKPSILCGLDWLHQTSLQA